MEDESRGRSRRIRDCYHRQCLEESGDRSKTVGRKITWTKMVGKRRWERWYRRRNGYTVELIVLLCSLLGCIGLSLLSFSLHFRFGFRFLVVVFRRSAALFGLTIRHHHHNGDRNTPRRGTFRVDWVEVQVAAYVDVERLDIQSSIGNRAIRDSPALVRLSRLWADPTVLLRKGVLGNAETILPTRSPRKSSSQSSLRPR